MTQGQLVLSQDVVKEIMKEVHAKFMLHTENISMHADTHAIIIHVFPRKGEEFILPEGKPVDVRIQRDKFEILGRGQ